MARIPLNKFRSKWINLLTSTGVTHVYEAPENRASILILAQITNNTANDRTVNVGVSSNNDLTSPGTFYLVRNFPIPAYDSRSVISGRVVLQGNDNDTILSSEVLFAQDTTTGLGLTGLTFNLGILDIFK
jgi:hypothetical protein